MPEAKTEPIATRHAYGDALAEMPLLLDVDRYVRVPLETTYQAAFRGRPAFWREILEAPRQDA